ncbi:hypothetical protein L0Y65_02240 [Candidatus Micrarchaeota archaeon]|nr:hypothetical protein [Candidatus Micrarchaeota archaeon]
MADTGKFKKTLKAPGAARVILNEGNQVTRRDVLAEVKRRNRLHIASFGRPPEISHLDFMKKNARVDKSVEELMAREGDDLPSQDEKAMPVYYASPTHEFLASFKDGFFQMLSFAVSSDKPFIREVEYCLGSLCALCRGNNLDPDDQIDYLFFEIKDEFEVSGKLSHTMRDGRAIQFSFEELVFINQLGALAKRHLETGQCTMSEAMILCLKKAWEDKQKAKNTA